MESAKTKAPQTPVRVWDAAIEQPSPESAHDYATV